MYKATPITKRAGSPLQNDLVDANARMHKDSKKDPSIDIITKSTKKGTEGKKGKEITKKVEGDKPTSIVKPGDPGYDKWLAAVTKDPSIEDRFKDREVGTGEFEPDEPGTPDETNYQATELFRQDFGTNVGDIEQREMNRVTKKAEKDVRRGKIKTARSESRGYTVNDEGVAEKTGEKLKGKDKRNFLKDARQKAKAEERAAETKSLKNRASNAAKGQASGKGLDQSYRRTDVVKTKGDFSDDTQIAQDQLKQDMAASNAKEAVSNSNTINFNTDVNQYKSAGMQNVKMKDYAKDFASKNPVPMMRTPMKKNYFKK